MKTKLWQDEREKQRLLSDFVENQVYLCLSMLMGDCLPRMMEDGDYQDEAMNLLYGRTYFVPYDNGGDADEKFDSEEEAEAWIQDCIENGDIHNKEAWQIDERTDEIFEHWAVSSWLGERLKAKKYAVEEICGITIWGRPTTGQAIHLDGVIEEIYTEMMEK